MSSFETGPDRLLRATDFVFAGRDDRELRRQKQKGALVAVRPGVFIPVDVWRQAEGRDQHILRAEAARPRLGAHAAFSHATAAALHGWAHVETWPELVDITDPDVARSRRGATARVHAFRLSDEDACYRAGLPVTSPGRTAVDLASTLPFRDAVVALDSALALPRKRGSPKRAKTILQLADLDAALARRAPVRAHRRVVRARDFADGASGSPGESLSRVMLLEIGWPAPIQQQSFSDVAGKIGDVDFWWPEYGLVGEFDGFVKYSRGDMLNGRTPAEAAVAEKRREDRLRAHRDVRGFARWMWSDLAQPGRLKSIPQSAATK